MKTRATTAVVGAITIILWLVEQAADAQTSEPVAIATPTASPGSVKSQNGNETTGQNSFPVELNQEFQLGDEDVLLPEQEFVPGMPPIVLVKYNQEFQLGDYSYKVTSVKSTKAVGPEFAREKASEGACFILVDFMIRNDGKQTAERDESVRVLGDFRLRDSEGREFSPDSRATSTASSDFVRRELHPGIFKRAVTVFEVPDGVTRANFQVLVPERSSSNQARKTVTLFLSSNKPSASAAATATPKPKHTSKKQTARRRNSDEITSEQRELWRRMSRPPGVPWRNFSAPDEHNYPNN